MQTVNAMVFLWEIHWET